jgi:choline transport protein
MSPSTTSIQLIIATAGDVRVDDVELEAQGYTREMPRQFSTLSLMSTCFALLATWNGFGASSGTGFTEASLAGSIWNLFIAGFMTVVTAVGMAELSSAYPVAGAQFYSSYAGSRVRIGHLSHLTFEFPS